MQALTLSHPKLPAHAHNRMHTQPMLVACHQWRFANATMTATGICCVCISASRVALTFYSLYSVRLLLVKGHSPKPPTGDMSCTGLHTHNPAALVKYSTTATGGHLRDNASRIICRETFCTTQHVGSKPDTPHRTNQPPFVPHSTLYDAASKARSPASQYCVEVWAGHSCRALHGTRFCV
jgi:hypothetical protein